MNEKNKVPILCKRQVRLNQKVTGRNAVDTAPLARAETGAVHLDFVFQQKRVHRVAKVSNLVGIKKTGVQLKAQVLHKQRAAKIL